MVHTVFLARKSQFQTGFWVRQRNPWVSEQTITKAPEPNEVPKTLSYTRVR